MAERYFPGCFITENAQTALYDLIGEKMELYLTDQEYKRLNEAISTDGKVLMTLGENGKMFDVDMMCASIETEIGSNNRVRKVTLALHHLPR